MTEQVQVAATVPTETPITYPVAALAGSATPAAARRFLGFMLTPAAQTVFARHGFGKP
jgi:molybdate transport system substrate-binding protein